MNSYVQWDVFAETDKKYFEGSKESIKHKCKVI